MKYIYCNPQVFQIVKPEIVSKVLFDEFFLPYCVAGYSDKAYKELNEVDEKRYEEEGAWWRGLNRTNVGLDEEKGMYGIGYKPKVMRKVGLLTYICDQYNASTEKNVAAFIGEFSAYECKNGIEFFNSIDKL